MYYKHDPIVVSSDGMTRVWRVVEVKNYLEPGKQRIRACLPSNPKISQWLDVEDISGLAYDEKLC